MMERLILNFQYLQNVRLKRHHNFIQIIRSEETHFLLREVAFSEAPIAYDLISSVETFDLRTLKRPLVEQRHKVRLFEQRLWWPLVFDDRKITLSRFAKLAASGELNTFLASADTPFRESPEETILKEFGISDHDDRLAKVHARASKLIIFGQHLYVEAREPVWFAFPRTRYPADFVISVGPAALDLWESWVPGPDREVRLDCCKPNRTFGLEEIDIKIAHWRSRGVKVEVRSKIKSRINPQRPETAAKICARALVESLWKEWTARWLFLMIRVRENGTHGRLPTWIAEKSCIVWSRLKSRCCELKIRMRRRFYRDWMRSVTKPFPSRMRFLQRRRVSVRVAYRFFLDSLVHNPVLRFTFGRFREALSRVSPRVRAPIALYWSSRTGPRRKLQMR
jgi:hypothetical protein